MNAPATFNGAKPAPAESFTGENLETRLDIALELTFPASDPVAITIAATRP